MRKVLVRIAAQVAITLWLGIMAFIGISSSFYAGGYLAALAMGLFLLIAGGFLEGIVYMEGRDGSW